MSGEYEYVEEQARLRHPSVRQVARWFDFRHLADGKPRAVSTAVADLAGGILAMIPADDPELTAGLRKLLEAKDCFVRAAIVAQEPHAAPGDMLYVTPGDGTAVDQSWAKVAAGRDEAREQMRLARQDRDQLRKQVLDLAAELEASAARTAPSKKTDIENATAAKLRKAARPPS